MQRDLQSLLNELDEYLGSVDEPSEDFILTIGTYFHAKFEFIHPFADGNGRVGRTLLNYFLMINDHPPIIIYDEDKNLYYDCLQEYDTKEEIKPLLQFLIYETEKTWSKSLEVHLGEEQSRDKILEILLWSFS